jgi:hypothetical protein
MLALLYGIVMIYLVFTWITDTTGWLSLLSGACAAALGFVFLHKMLQKEREGRQDPGDDLSTVFITCFLMFSIYIIIAA